MVERKMELKRRYHRKKKMAKLKAKLVGVAPGPDREKIIYKIRCLSPWWLEPGTVVEKREPVERVRSAPKSKPGPRQKPEGKK